ncbi:TetR/AcrR family transcriptional regulator [Leifsonia poae]|uniref:TetR family transcriptional regulator n=1 Tax=Leifsonia poae TaxID=110933 RepID=A0A9W6HDI7_9MICO|nr:TetR/AcrR family transcriptional regulator [Leifsonia poae]GLJ78069.1 TetR family transcriptional regulator [Leifsonia poae]
MATGRPGRTRSEKSWQAILEATRDELAAQGYDRLSIDRIATAAGVGKQTVYRWYPSKSSLVAECILRGYVVTPGIDILETGSVRDDIAAWLEAFAAGSRSPGGAALIRAGTAAAAEDEEVAARYAEVTKKTEDALVERLETGIAAGQLPAETPAATLAEALVGALLFKVVARQEISPQFISDLLNLVFTKESLHPEESV